MIIRSARPEDFEMPLEGFLHWLTPTDRFFVRTHLYRPKVDAAVWRLRVEGEVRTPLTLDMAALRQLPRVELVSVLECAGNGRGFYRPTVPGAQWRYGAVGNARWAGVRLADVLRKAGLKAGAKQVLLNGADVPMGAVPDFQRTVEISKAVHPDTLLAFEMNGAPLPESHGFPLRLVVPGWAGDSWVKWVTNIQVLDRDFDGFFMKTAYRRPPHPVEPGTAVDPAKMQPVTGIRPKSVIATPLDGQHVGPGAVTLRGAAWAGEAPLARVDVSTDNGRTWRPARLGADRARYGWRLWEAEWNPPPAGSYVLMARATDTAGEIQPLAQDWNPSGYLWNVVQQVRVTVGQGAAVAAPAESLPTFPPEVKASCVGCHGEDMMAGQRLTRAQWERELDKMTRWGASVKPADRPAILDFLAGHFGPR
ncbi:MAG TPA: sulfite oxidase [Bryobacteraceae bacterium]|nr:sulfite oxidase [Bryobacteraceae bacterium]